MQRAMKSANLQSDLSVQADVPRIFIGQDKTLDIRWDVNFSLIHPCFISAAMSADGRLPTLMVIGFSLAIAAKEFF